MISEQVLTDLITKQTEKTNDLLAAAQEALKRHYLLMGAHRQAADHLQELQSIKVGAGNEVSTVEDTAGLVGLHEKFPATETTGALRTLRDAVITTEFPSVVHRRSCYLPLETFCGKSIANVAASQIETDTWDTVTCVDCLSKQKTNNDKY